MDKWLTGIVLIIALGPFPAWADKATHARNAYRSGDYVTARIVWREAADQGDAEAQMHLGYLYEQGLGVERDLEQAVSLYRRAAQAGLADAQYQLGLMYELGIGVESDPDEAQAWYLRAVEQGFCPGELAGPGEMR